MTVDLEDVGTDALVNAKIIPLLPPGIPVIFSFNPSKISITRTAMTRSRGNSSTQGGSPAGSSQTWTATGPRILTCGEVYIEGPQAHTLAQQLLEMMSPTGGLLGSIMALAGINLIRRPPILLFEWGPLTLLCTMKSCTVEYQRFHASGMPLRAKCNVSLQEEKSWFSMLLTNPTSGGLPGREQHTVVAGENLQHVATRTYGNPGQWRALAEANGVDDPFAVRPGDVIFVPSPSEVGPAR